MSSALVVRTGTTWMWRVVHARMRVHLVMVTVLSSLRLIEQGRTTHCFTQTLTVHRHADAATIMHEHTVGSMPLLLAPFPIHTLYHAWVGCA